MNCPYCNNEMKRSEDMKYLKKIERYISLYDGMLKETGGSFGKGKLGGDKYEEKCLEIAKNTSQLVGQKKNCYLL